MNERSHSLGWSYHFLQSLSHNAHWMTDEELKLDFHEEDTYQFTREWAFIGRYKGRSVLLSPSRWDRHLFITGSEKQAVSMLTQLFQSVTSRRVSSVFFDPLSRLHALSQWFGHSHDVRFIAPGALDKSLLYNPLAFIPTINSSDLGKHAGMISKQDQRARSLAQMLVESIPSTRVAKYAAIREQAETLLHACIIHLRLTEADAPFSALARLLVERRELLGRFAQSPSAWVKSCGENIKLLGREYQEAMVDFLTPVVTFLSRKEIQTLTASNQIDFRDLLYEPVALFYMLPEQQAQLYRPLTKILFSQLTFMLRDAWHEEIMEPFLGEDSSDTFNSVHIGLDRLDQLGVLSSLPGWVRDLSENQYRIAFAMTAPDRQTVMDQYGAEMGSTMLRNLHLHLLLPGGVPADCQVYADYCGKFLETPAEHADQEQVLCWLVTPEELQHLPPGSALLCPVDTPPALITIENAR